MDLINTENLSFRYPDAQQTFKFPDIQLSKGENLLLRGNSGSGKTTLMHLLSGILTPTAGTLKIDGISIETLKPHEMDSFRGEKIGIIFQENYFLESVSVLANLTSISSLCGVKPDKVYLENLLGELDITHLSGKKPNQLSRGELQRFSIARALINKPIVLLADEPTSSLDDDNCMRFIELIKQTGASHNLSLIVATHDTRLKNEFKNSIAL
jgi:putative ABC transport system ATP-binding protein